ncbi:unnamed protein product [Caenorhabditis nigoni]
MGPENFEGPRMILINFGISEMLADQKIQERYPQFYQFLLNEQPSWFEPAPYNSTVIRLRQATPKPENYRTLRKDIKYEMLELMYRFFRQKNLNAQLKRMNEELLEANEQHRIAAIQMSEEKSKLQQILESAYNNGFVEYDNNGDTVLRVSTYQTTQSAAPPTVAHQSIASSVVPQFSSSHHPGFPQAVHFEYKKLVEMYKLENRRAMIAEQLVAQRESEAREILRSYTRLRLASVQMLLTAKEERSYSSNSLLKEIQQLNKNKNYVVRQHHKDNETLTKSLMAIIYTIVDDGREDQAVMEQLRTDCSCAEKNYQEELVRLRGENLDYERAIEQRQEALFYTLTSRNSEISEAAKELHQALYSSQVEYCTEMQRVAAPAVIAQQPIVGAHQLLSRSRQALIKEISHIHVGEEQERVVREIKWTSMVLYLMLLEKIIVCSLFKLMRGRLCLLLSNQLRPALVQNHPRLPILKLLHPSPLHCPLPAACQDALPEDCQIAEEGSTSTIVSFYLLKMLFN